MLFFRHARIERCTYCLTRSHRHISSKSHNLTAVNILEAWDRDSFIKQAFAPAVPAILPRDSRGSLPPACVKWFVHDDDPKFDVHSTVPTRSTLKLSYWEHYREVSVSLELTLSPSTSDSTSTGTTRATTFFQRTDAAPFHLLLSHIASTSPDLDDTSSSLPQPSLYLAQQSLSDLPLTLQADLPTPAILSPSSPFSSVTTTTTDPSPIAEASSNLRGDIYASSLWLSSAFPASQTPLHRDPNPNLHLQLCGKKIIRLFPPEIGNEIFEYVREQTAVEHVTTAKDDDGRGSGNDIDRRSGSGSTSAAFRGDEMMIGEERRLLDEIVWGNDINQMRGVTDGVDGSTVSDAHNRGGSVQSGGEVIQRSHSSFHNDEDNLKSQMAQRSSHDPWGSFRQNHALEAQIGMGDTLFIPRGWWHAVRGIEDRSPGTVVASVNWWFR